MQRISKGAAMILEGPDSIRKKKFNDLNLYTICIWFMEGQNGAKQLFSFKLVTYGAKELFRSQKDKSWKVGPTFEIE